MTRLNLGVPLPEAIRTDAQARELLQLCLWHVDNHPDDIIGWDTETHAKAIPYTPPGKKSGGGGKILDWMHDNITFWGLSLYDRQQERWRRWALDRPQLHLFVPLLENPQALFGTWNGRYDAHVTYNSWIHVWQATMLDFNICGSLLNENLQGRLGLKDVSVRGFTPEWRRAYRAKIRKRLLNEGWPPPKIEEAWKEIDEEALAHCTEWEPVHMTKFKDLFNGCTDAMGNPVKEFVTSLYDLPRDLVEDYSSLDPYATVRIAYHIRDVMQDVDMTDHSGYDNLWDYFWNFERHITEVVWSMERRGMPVDTTRFDAMMGPMQEELDKIQLEINREAGWPVNLNSPKQLQKLLYGPNDEGGMGLRPRKMTKGGESGPQPSTDEGALEKLAADGVGIVHKILRYRKVDKSKGTYALKLSFLGKYFEDGRIHPGIKQYGARTGRFSTENPNSQNFPQPDNDEFGIRKAFTAHTPMEMKFLDLVDKGELEYDQFSEWAFCEYWDQEEGVDIKQSPVLWVPDNTLEPKKLLVVDYGQLEMRILAHFSQDKGLIDTIMEGKDMHCVTVEKMFGIPYDEVKAAKRAKDNGEATPEQAELAKKRSHGKTVGFALMYGAGRGNISIQLGVDKDTAQDLIDRYFAGYPGVKRFIDRTVRQCRQDLFVTTILGRRRNLPTIMSNDRANRAHAEREAPNAKIQGSAADLTKGAMLRCYRDRRLERMRCYLLNQIHDELVFEVPIRFADECSSIVQQNMIHPFVEGVDPLIVPLTADPKVCDNWAEAK